MIPATISSWLKSFTQVHWLQVMQFFFCQHFWDGTKQHQGGAQSQPSERLHHCQWCRGTLAGFSRKIKQICWTPWPSSALQCQGEPGADLSASDILLEQTLPCWSSLHMQHIHQRGKESTSLHWARRPWICDGLEWFPCIPIAVHDLLPMGHNSWSSASPSQLSSHEHCWSLCAGQKMWVYVSIGVTRHKSIPKSSHYQSYQNYQLFILVSTEFMVQERAKSRSSHLTTQASLHPKSVQSSIRAEA